MQKQAIICDLDGTLCNIDHRLKYIDGSLGKKDWDKFYSECANDIPNEWCKTIIEMINDASWDNVFIFYITGRPEQYRGLTESWFSNNGSYLFSEEFDSLFMRKDGDYRKDHVIKKEIYEEHIKGKYDILFCLEDRKQVVDMWREQGLVCLQCAPGDF